MRKQITRDTLLAACAFASIAGVPAIAQPVDCPGANGLAESPAKPAQVPLSKEHGVALPTQLPVVVLPPIDNGALIERDVARNDGGIYWVSEGRTVTMDFSEGKWFDTADGGRLWAIDVLSPTAYGLRLHFSEFSLPQGAQLVTYAPLGPARVEGPYSGTGPLSSGEFWAGTTYAQAARVELYLPRGVVLHDTPFKLDSLQHMYRNPEQALTPELSCHQDWTCWSGWATVGQSVARMYFVHNGGGGLCTGQLVNSLNSDLTPYFTSANHCISDEATANTLETYWFYSTASCNGTVPDLSTLPRASYAHMLSNSSTGDYSFMLIEGAVPRSAYWNGWTTAVPAAGTYVTGISHPAGSYKRISFGQVEDWVSNCNGVSTTTTTHVQAGWWLGTTEPGSSGSAIYDPSTTRMLGVYSCQSTQCPNDQTTNFASYGKFAYIYGGASGYLNGGSDDGYEPNDSCSQARYLGGVGYTYWGSNLVVKLYSEDWYRITVPYGGTVASSISFTSANGDIDMGLYDGCGGTLVASSTGVGDSENITYTNNTGASHDYYIRVYLYNDTRNQYAFATNVTAPTPPASDNCSNATYFTEGQAISGATNFATADGAASCGSSTGTRDVWYAYYAPCSGILTLDTYGADYDTVLSAYTGCPGNTTSQIICNDDAAPPERWSQIAFAVTKGSVYYVRVAGYNGAFGNFQLHSVLSPPSNDSCASAVELGEGSFYFNSCGCTTDGPPEPQCDFYSAPQIENDFWNTYTASGTGTLTVATCGADYDSKIALYDASQGCPTTENSALICNDDSCSLQSSISYHVTAGMQYYIRTGGYRGARGSGTLSISLALDPPPSCPADFNQDGTLDFFDYLDFVNAFSSGDAAADFNSDGTIDFFDYLDFVNAFAVGC